MKASPAKADVLRSKKTIKLPGWFCRSQRAAKWPPKLLVAFCIAVLLVIPAIWLWFNGEAFFSLTRRLPAEVLVVEGWIGKDGVLAAAAEFERGGYQYIVATGGQPDDRQDAGTYAEMAEKALIQSGIPKDRIIIAPTGEIEHERTFKSAVAAWRALQRRGIHSEAINVLTLGPHARRSRLVYAKVYALAAQVGIIAWAPSYYKTEPWWRSRGRTKCFLKEIVGYPFEALLNSGRVSNSPSEPITTASDGR